MGIGPKNLAVRSANENLECSQKNYASFSGRIQKKKLLVQAGECAKEGNATQELHVQAGKSAKEGTKELFAMAAEYVEQGSMKWTST